MSVQNHLRQRKLKKGFDNILSGCKQFTRAYTVEIFLGSLCISFYLLCFLYHKHEQIAYSNETQSADQKSLHVLHATTCLLTVFLVI